MSFNVTLPYHLVFLEINSETDKKREACSHVVVLRVQANFVRPLLSHDPDSRPSADEILQDPLISDFEETSKAYQRLRTHSRDRTVSSSSGNSVGGSYDN